MTENPRVVDLHTHTTASDGTDSPCALVAGAAHAGIDVLAITDHDTTAGWDEARSALPAGMTLVPGVELSCVSADGIAVHLLGYLFDPTAPALATELRHLRDERVRRTRVMAERMAADGLPIDPEAVLASAGASVGRPHLGQALIRAGVVTTMDEAFAGPLSRRGAYYEEKRDVAVVEAVAMVTRAGGVSVLAHARAASRGRTLDDAAIAALADAGLRGLEVDHHDHTPADRAHLRALAGRLGLVPTGSSDYHGANKTVRLGAEHTALDQYERLVSGATGSVAVTG